jgi:hypothetical protein
MKRRSRFEGGLRALIVLAGSLILASISPAAPVQYTYTGTNFLYIESCPTCIGGQPVTTADHVSAYFVLYSPLGGNFSGDVTPMDWVISDGFSLFSSANAILTPTGNSNFGQVYVETNSLGAIARWRMNAETPADVGGNFSACQPGGARCIAIGTFFFFADANSPLTSFDSSFYYPFGGATTSVTDRDGVPGSWTLSTPELPPLLFLGAGIAVVSGLRVLRQPSPTLGKT